MISFAQLARSEAGITIRLAPFLSPVLREVKQGQHLHGLAEAHVVGKAHAELQGVQKGEPVDAFLLVGPEFGFEGRRRAFQKRSWPGAASSP